MIGVLGVVNYIEIMGGWALLRAFMICIGKCSNDGMFLIYIKKLLFATFICVRRNFVMSF